MSGKARQPLQTKEGNIAFSSRATVLREGLFGILHVCVVDKNPSPDHIASSDSLRMSLCSQIEKQGTQQTPITPVQRCISACLISQSHGYSKHLGLNLEERGFTVSDHERGMAVAPDGPV